MVGREVEVEEVEEEEPMQTGILRSVPTKSLGAESSKWVIDTNSLNRSQLEIIPIKFIRDPNLI